MLGGHLVKSWSSTQSCVTLSSGEAEFYALVKATGIGLGLQEFLRDMGVEIRLRVHADSAAAVGISKRVGLGTQRHVAVNALWIQDRLRRKQFEVFKVKGDKNPADLFTKHLNFEKLSNCLSFMNCEYREGRPEGAPMRKNDKQLLREDDAWHYDEDMRNDDLVEEEEFVQNLEERDGCKSERIRWADTDGSDGIDDELLRLWNHSTSSTSTASQAAVRCTFHR